MSETSGGSACGAGEGRRRRQQRIKAEAANEVDLRRRGRVVRVVVDE